LLGDEVRYDGGHKHDHFLTDTLGKWVEYVPVCPEYECGMPIPREPLRLVGDPEAPRLVTVNTGIDKTEQMVRWARKRVIELEREGLLGFIFKSDSPSSGMQRVKVYDNKGMPTKNGVGIFARIIMEHFPLLPVEDDCRLHNPALHENFLERIFTLARCRQMLAERRSVAGLIEFHTRHKFLILAHSPVHYRELGRLVAMAKQFPLKELFSQYEKMLFEALKLRATARKNANVLMHMAGYLKDYLSADERQELLEIIDRYRRELLPLVVPIALLNHYVRKYDYPYLKEQVYLNPHPAELKLRNHA